MWERRRCVIGGGKEGGSVCEGCYTFTEVRLMQWG